MRLLGLFAIFALTAGAQTTTAQLTGQVTDSSGAVIPSAQVSMLSTGTGDDGSSKTNESGYYTFGLLPPDSYRLQVRKDGFRSGQRSRAPLRAGRVRR